MAGRSRVVPILGVVAAGGVGYYLYAAGGDPKLAEKKFESVYPCLDHCYASHAENVPEDAASASARVKSDLPGSSKEAKKQGEVWARETGAKLDSTVSCSSHTRSTGADRHRSTPPKPNSTRLMPSLPQRCPRQTPRLIT